VSKAQLKTDIRMLEARAKAHTEALANMAAQWDMLMAQYHGVVEGSWVTGTGASGIEWTGQVVEIDWEGVSLTQKPKVKIRAYTASYGRPGMRLRVLDKWKLTKAPKVAA
jgi:hypothetical protein